MCTPRVSPVQVELREDRRDISLLGGFVALGGIALLGDLLAPGWIKPLIGIGYCAVGIALLVGSRPWRA